MCTLHRRSTVLASICYALFVHTSSASCPRGLYNNKICSGNGACSPQNLCLCDNHHIGFDCSQHRCPMGKAWVAPARAPDDAHFEVECSNKGICDRSTGFCSCMEGFTGTACQRLECPDSCSDAGECMSLKALSRLLAVETEPVYDRVWDADMIYGCKCSKGRHDFDCSKRSCPRGDDPLTGGQVNEVQILRCTAKGGSFALYFNGEGVTVPFDATIEQLQLALRRIKGMPTVKVTYTIGSSLCNSAAMNPVLVEFIETFGPQPPLKAFGITRSGVALADGNVLVATGGAPLGGRVSVRGTKEWELCSNRGDCDIGRGKCYCYIVPMPGFRSSDGYGNPGTRGDCGAANDKNKYGGAIASCAGELACSGHGTCTKAPSFRCACEDGWTSGDCSLRTCPQGPSWFRQPSSANTVHNQWTECSDVGSCDMVLGECECFSPFSGSACEHMKCPGEPTCNGHGQCMSIRQLSLEADVDDPLLRFDYGADPNNAHTFDRDSILGCQCDTGFEGYDCSQQSCPRGDDPTTQDQVDEVQLLQCTATSGTFQLLYRTHVSTDIPFDASPSELRSTLIDAFGFEDPVVTYSAGDSACSSAAAAPVAQNVITIAFPLDHGDLPPLRADATLLGVSGGGGGPQVGSVLVATNGAVLGAFVSQAGTKENAVCANKGTCDYDTGQCICGAGYGSSDGRGNVGTRGDCGYILPKVVDAVA